MKNSGYDYPDRVSRSDEGLTVLAFYARSYRHSSESEWREKIAQGQVTRNGRQAAPGRHPQARRPSRLSSPAVGGAGRARRFRRPPRGRGRPRPGQAVRTSGPAGRVLPRKHPPLSGPPALRRLLLAAPPPRPRHVGGDPVHPQPSGRALAGDGHVRATHPQGLSGPGLGDVDAGGLHRRRSDRPRAAHPAGDRQRLSSRRQALDKSCPRPAPIPR